MNKRKIKLGRKKGSTNAVKTIKGLSSLFYSLAISTIGLQMAFKGINKMFGEEIRIRMLEFKLMNVIEIEKRDKGIIIEYHKLKGINNYIKNFLRRNPKWKSEEEIYGEIKTGRIILTRIYRTYHKKFNEEDHCAECGRSYED